MAEWNMNTDIDESDCAVIQKEGSEVGKRGVGSAGSKDPADADASAPSPEVGEGAVGSRGDWAMATRRKSKAASAVSTSPQLAKTAKVFASSSELERKRKAEQSMADQIAALREMVLQLIKGQEEQRSKLRSKDSSTRNRQPSWAQCIRRSERRLRSTVAQSHYLRRSRRKA
jgi:hypothetical protein